MNVITARDARDWEAWLETHHGSEAEVWIRIAKKASGVASVQPAEATEVALCFGWIDSHRVGGHGILPTDGQLISPLAVTKTPH